MDDEDIFNGYGIRVNLKADFSKIREVLTRIGIANNRTKTLTQTCHIFHKKGQYALMHFKEMFLFDNKKADFTEEDEARRNRIVTILEQWRMVEILDDISDENEFIMSPVDSINIISRDIKINEKWNLVAKYTLGKKLWYKQAQ